MIITIDSIVYDKSRSEYKVLDFIGSGSFGLVYKIQKKESKEIFALKTLQTPFADQKILKAFLNEGSLAISVSHNNVVKYHYFHDGSQYEDFPVYIIMDYADGGTLKKIIDEKRQQSEFFTNDELKAYFIQLIDGMEAINQHLVHRDIKPDNILISESRLKITDFGLSKIVEASTRQSSFKGFGCIPYLAPEGWKLGKNTIQMDIYSMGFVFYELATLRHPLEVNTNDIEDWREAHLFQSVKTVDKINPNVSPILGQLIMKMIEKNTAERFENWKSIRELFQKQDLSPTSNSKLVENFLKQRLEKDTKIREEQLEKEKREREITEFKKIIQYQVESEVIEPIKKFIDEFNLKYEGRQIRFDSIVNEWHWMINMPSGSQIDIEVKQILEKDFYRERIVDDYGRRVRVRELQLPEYKKNRIMAWGYLKSSNGRGMNIILVKESEEIYGAWYMLINRMSGFARSDRVRPEPFPFEFNEIEEEIRNITAIHIYNTDHRPLNIEFIKQFIGEFI